MNKKIWSKEEGDWSTVQRKVLRQRTVTGQPAVLWSTHKVRPVIFNISSLQIVCLSPAPSISLPPSTLSLNLLVRSRGDGGGDTPFISQAKSCQFTSYLTTFLDLYPFLYQPPGEQRRIHGLETCRWFLPGRESNLGLLDCWPSTLTTPQFKDTEEIG